MRIFPFLGSFAFHLALLGSAILISHSSSVLLSPQGSSQPVSVMIQETPPARAEKTAVRKAPAPQAPTSLPNQQTNTGANPSLKEGVADGDPNPGRLAEYVFGLRKLIESKKRYPSLSKKMGETGKVLVSLQILRSGIIQEVRIKNRSSFARLDEAALETVSEVRQYHPIPDTIPQERISVEVPIEFSL